VTAMVYWLEQAACDVPPGDEWLSATEAAALGAMRFTRRRADWRLGRWTAKRAVAAWLQLDTLAGIRIRAAPSGVPEVLVAETPAPVKISLSHRGGRAACAIARPEVELGCDLELIEDRSAAFAADYFTAREQILIAQAEPADRLLLLALLWSAKESVLKALGEGLRLDTRSVAIAPGNAWAQPCVEWRPIEARCDTGRLFHGWWQQSGRWLRTVMADPACEEPEPTPSPARVSRVVI